VVDFDSARTNLAVADTVPDIQAAHRAVSALAPDVDELLRGPDVHQVGQSGSGNVSQVPVANVMQAAEAVRATAAALGARAATAQASAAGLVAEAAEAQAAAAAMQLQACSIAARHGPVPAEAIQSAVAAAEGAAEAAASAAALGSEIILQQQQQQQQQAHAQHIHVYPCGPQAGGREEGTRPYSYQVHGSDAAAEAAGLLHHHHASGAASEQATTLGCGSSNRSGADFPPPSPAMRGLHDHAAAAAANAAVLVNLGEPVTWAAEKGEMIATQEEAQGAALGGVHGGISLITPLSQHGVEGSGRPRSPVAAGVAAQVEEEAVASAVVEDGVAAGVMDVAELERIAEQVQAAALAHDVAGEEAARAAALVACGEPVAYAVKVVKGAALAPPPAGPSHQ